LRFSIGVAIGATLLHLLLRDWLSAKTLFLMAPYLVLAATTWLIRTPWVVWLALGSLVLIESSVVAVYLASASSTGELVVSAFGIAASGVQVPIAVLVAVVRSFQKES